MARDQLKISKTHKMIPITAGMVIPDIFKQFLSKQIAGEQILVIPNPKRNSFSEICSDNFKLQIDWAPSKGAGGSFNTFFIVTPNPEFWRNFKNSKNI
jgi:hypothetical protein